MNQPTGRPIIFLAGLAVMVCCALPALLALTAGVAIVGLAAHWWLAAGLSVAAVAGLLRYRRSAASEHKKDNSCRPRSMHRT